MTTRKQHTPVLDLLSATRLGRALWSTALAVVFPSTPRDLRDAVVKAHQLRTSPPPSHNSTGDPVVHLVRRGRYPHVVARNSGASVRQSQVLAEVTCAMCLGEAERFLRSGAGS